MLAASQPGSSKPSSVVSNVHQRTDKAGSFFDAHDGSTHQFEAGG